MDSSTWTEDAKGEKLFRAVLKELRIQYQEGNEQQVRTWLDELF
jgi:hypothetical protein